MRNMETTAKKIKGKFNADSGLDRYDMVYEEMARLINMCRAKNEMEAISMAFNYGFVLGNRATVAGKIKEKL